MPTGPAPIPPLDMPPPSPENLEAQEPEKPSFNALNPEASLSSSVQTAQIAFEVAAGIAKMYELLGDMFPSFTPLAGQLQEQLRAGLKVALEQGLAKPAQPAPRASFDMLNAPPDEGSF